MFDIYIKFLFYLILKYKSCKDNNNMKTLSKDIIYILCFLIMSLNNVRIIIILVQRQSKRLKKTHIIFKPQILVLKRNKALNYLTKLTKDYELY